MRSRCLFLSSSTSSVPLVSSLVFTVFFTPGPCPPAALRYRLKHKRGRRGREIGGRRRGREGPCVRMEKNDPAPCGQTLTRSQARTSNASQDLGITHPNKERQQCQSKDLFLQKTQHSLLNYTTGGPYGRARLGDRWTECRNKELSAAFQLGPGWTNADRWSVKSHQTQDRKTPS